MLREECDVVFRHCGRSYRGGESAVPCPTHTRVSQLAPFRPFGDVLCWHKADFPWRTSRVTDGKAGGLAPTIRNPLLAIRFTPNLKNALLRKRRSMLSGILEACLKPGSMSGTRHGQRTTKSSRWDLCMAWIWQ